MNLPASFVHDAPAMRVIFGAGSRTNVVREVEGLGIDRAFVITSPRLAEESAGSLGPRAVAVHTAAMMHVPIETVREARTRASSAGANGLVAIGGGSTIGLAKALALETGWPILAIPTTYAGSEMTSVWGITEGGVKRTGRDARVRPRTVIYDPDLHRSLPPKMVGPSALNATAHAMEALYARGVDPITARHAEESVRAIAQNLPALVASNTDDAARRGVLYGAWLAGVCLDRAAMGVHHKLCHVLGGTFGLPHSEVHAVILPHAAAFNRAAAPEAMSRLGAALGSDDVPKALASLAVLALAPTSLAAIGMKESDLDRAAALATENPYDNPRPIERAAIRTLLADAFAGAEPGASFERSR